MTTTSANDRTGAGLVEKALFDRLAARVAGSHQLEPEFAKRIVDQALVFLVGCAENPDVSLAPSRTVDLGWHAFLLCSREYDEFCRRHGGRFLHHVPDDGYGEDVRPDVLSPVATADLLRNRGFQIDVELWYGDSSDCSQCHAGCYDSPKAS